MILEFIEAMDIGRPNKQRLLFKAIKDGNLFGSMVFYGRKHLYSFPQFEVSKGEFVVLYLTMGEQCSQEFPDANCHYFYQGSWLCYWEEPAHPFHLRYRAT